MYGPVSCALCEQPNSHCVTVELNRESQQQSAHRSRGRQRYREMHRGHTQNGRFHYPRELQALPAFGKWLKGHVRELRSSGFPIPEDVVKLYAPPSKVVSSYSKIWAYGAHYRCGDDISPHATYDSGVALIDSEVVPGAIDVSILDAVYMVTFGSLNVVVLKLSWLKHVDQGRRCIKRDAAGFWTALYNAREDPRRQNRFVLPRNASQIFFRG